MVYLKCLEKTLKVAEELKWMSTHLGEKWMRGLGWVGSSGDFLQEKWVLSGKRNPHDSGLTEWYHEFPQGPKLLEKS